MVAEALVYKGLVALWHLAATHITAGAAVSLVHAAAGMTISQLATTVVTAGFIAGCIKWTYERLDNLKKGAKAISDCNYYTAIKEFGLLAISSGIDVNLLPDSVEKALEKINLDSIESRKITSWVKNHELEIAQYVKNHK